VQHFEKEGPMIRTEPADIHVEYATENDIAAAIVAMPPSGWKDGCVRIFLRESKPYGVWWDKPGQHPGSDRLAQMAREGRL
jgi:hypothetical protein